MIVAKVNSLLAVMEAEGVKLEEQVLLTVTGCEVLSRYPFEDDAFD